MYISNDSKGAYPLPITTQAAGGSISNVSYLDDLLSAV